MDESHGQQPGLEKIHLSVTSLLVVFKFREVVEPTSGESVKKTEKVLLASLGVREDTAGFQFISCQRSRKEARAWDVSESRAESASRRNCAHRVEHSERSGQRSLKQCLLALAKQQGGPCRPREEPCQYQVCDGTTARLAQIEERAVGKTGFRHNLSGLFQVWK